MPSTVDLWLPILVSAIAVFFVSSLVHMVLGYHRRDYDCLPNEDDVLASMRSAGVQPGEYVFPHCIDMKELATEPMIKKLEAGPIGFVSVMPSGSWRMGKTLLLWFLNCVFVSLLVGYVAALTVDPAATFIHKLRVVSAVAFLAYAGCNASASIWKAQRWSTTAKHYFDGVLYAIATGVVFAWLGPSVG